MKSALRITAIVAVLTLMSALPTLATRGNPDQAVPIAGWTAGTDSFAAPDEGCLPGDLWRYEHVGTGQVAHLGTVQVFVTHCTRLTGMTTGEAGPGTMTMTAANGDQLFFTHFGTFEVTVGPAGPVESIVSLEWEIVGGTGRFAGATGSGDGAGVSDLAMMTTAMSYWGSITYDASSASDE